LKGKPMKSLPSMFRPYNNKKRPTITLMSSKNHEFISLDSAKNWTTNAIILSKEKTRCQTAGALRKNNQRLNEAIVACNNALVYNALLECQDDNLYYANSKTFVTYFKLDEYKSKVDESTVTDYPKIIEDMSDLINTSTIANQSLMGLLSNHPMAGITYVANKPNWKYGLVFGDWFTDVTPPSKFGLVRWFKLKYEVEKDRFMMYADRCFMDEIMAYYSGNLSLPQP
jgi:hypothetical protein